MKPYGRKAHHHNYPDNHPPKGYMNWWEREIDFKSKKSERHKNIEIEDEEERILDWTWREKEVSINRCEDCLHFELVLGSRPWCHRFVKKLEYLMKQEKKHCYVFDFAKDKVVQRIEMKAW